MNTIQMYASYRENQKDLAERAAALDVALAEFEKVLESRIKPVVSKYASGEWTIAQFADVIYDILTT